MITVVIIQKYSVLSRDFKGIVCDTLHQLSLIVYQSLTSRPTVQMKKHIA